MLRKFHRIVEHDTHDGKYQERAECEWCQRLGCRNQNQVAQTLIRSHELSDDGTNDRKGGRYLKSDEDVRNRGWESDFQKGLIRSRRERSNQID